MFVERLFAYLHLVASGLAAGLVIARQGSAVVDAVAQAAAAPAGGAALDLEVVRSALVKQVQEVLAPAVRHVDGEEPRE